MSVIKKVMPFVVSTFLVGCTQQNKDLKSKTETLNFKLEKNKTYVHKEAIKQIGLNDNIRTVKFITDGFTTSKKVYNYDIYKGIRAFNGDTETNTVVVPQSSDLTSEKYELFSKTLKESQVIVTNKISKSLTAFANTSQSWPKNHGMVLLNGEIKNSKINSIIFNYEEAAFYAGYTAAEYLNIDKENYEKDGLKVGAFGGIKNKATISYMSGFQQGIKYWNANVKKGDLKVDFIKLGDKMDDYIVGSTKEGTSKTITENLLNKGADIILSAEYNHILDVAKTIKTKNSKSLIVGVETDRSKENVEYADYFFTTILTNYEIAVKKALNYIFKKGEDEIFGLGKTTVGTFQNNLIDIAKGGNNKLSIGQHERAILNENLMKKSKAIENIFWY